ncbi:putative inactive receptor kinase [Citrus sinensis]|uniref:Inactive receptor kinase n=1 Tax=Citrus sinensis TaxID=2711 RepID=A0ACB8J3A9_CITSI|nr:putative inactive receptor kinase [Citrus sinensis]
MTTKTAPFFSLLLFSLLHSTATAQYPPITNSLLPSDAVSLLSFKSKADSENKLLYALNERFDYCQWQGVKCAQGRVVRFVLQSFGLRGTFPPNTLTRLDQLRVLSLHNNSLTGPIPDLSSLINLKSLSLSRNFFSGAFPLSILSLHRLTILDLSYNNLTGLIPVNLTALDRLYSLKLEWNRFSGTVPPLNQPFLVVFNVSGNNLTGQVPETPTLLKFDASSFSMNPNLCGKVINKACRPRSPFFESPNATSPPRPLGQSAQSQGILVLSPPSPRNDHKRRGLILGLSIGFAVLVSFLVCIFLLIRRSSEGRNSKEPSTASFNEGTTYPEPESSRTANTTQVGECKIKVETKANKVQVEEMAIGSQTVIKRSGSLVFCAGESEVYSLEQLMRASAELLGRGSIGTTYKAVLDNHLIVTVKRFDANKTADTSAEAFEQHMEAVGGLSHPNLVPIRAYFQAKGERLVIYDYQPNGSLFNLIHGSRSIRAKPLHWTSCLKIAEDVAQGLAYIHRASWLIHGNLKSSNVLLGADFEARLTDYCLSVLSDSSSVEDPDTVAYKAPEIRKSSRRATSKSDVYAFGVLLLELLTGKHPSQHPYLAPPDMLEWVRTMRVDDGREENRLGMLTEVASVCSLKSPEQRPAMWQVLKMIQEIKESVMAEDNASFGYS